MVLNPAVLSVEMNCHSSDIRIEKGVGCAFRTQWFQQRVQSETGMKSRQDRSQGLGENEEVEKKNAGEVSLASKYAKMRGLLRVENTPTQPLNGKVSRMRTEWPLDGLWKVKVGKAKGLQG